MIIMLKMTITMIIMKKMTRMLVTEISNEYIVHYKKLTLFSCKDLLVSPNQEINRDAGYIIEKPSLHSKTVKNIP